MMRCGRKYLQVLLQPNNYAVQRYAKKVPPPEVDPITLNGAIEVELEEPINPFVLTRTVGNSYRRWQTVLERHPELKKVKRGDLINTANTLKSFDYNPEEICLRPMILYVNAKTLLNRHSVLRECGVEPVPISLLFKYVTVMNKTVISLKSCGYVPFDLDMVERLRQQFTDIDVKLPAGKLNENMELKEIRQEILNSYLRARLGMNEDELQKLWKTYARVRHKSFQSVQVIIDMLLNDLKFPKERIIKNGYLLHADSENVKRILEQIPTIGDHSIRDIAFRRPKIIMSSCESLLRTLEYVKAFNISEEAVVRCLEVLTLGSETVLERLRDLNEIEEFQVLGTNPRVLRLVHYQNKARLRLEYLNQLKVKCASLHILSCGSVAFAKFARDGSDRTKGRDVVVYLAKYMNRSEHEIRCMLSRHPNWCHIPVVQVKQCLDFLLSLKFDLKDIYHNLHLLLYPITRIEEKLIQIQSQAFFEDIQPYRMGDLTAREALTLTLYFIESEFHFTGDGIWTDAHTQNVENFNNLLPDFPESLNKIYKYGVKPPPDKVEKAVSPP